MLLINGHKIVGLFFKDSDALLQKSTLKINSPHRNHLFAATFHRYSHLHKNFMIGKWHDILQNYTFRKFENFNFCKKGIWISFNRERENKKQLKAEAVVWGCSVKKMFLTLIWVGGNFTALPTPLCWFSLNNSETVKAVILDFCCNQ